MKTQELKDIISKDEINKLVNEIVDEYVNRLNEEEPFTTQPNRPNIQQKPAVKHVSKPNLVPNKSVPKKRFEPSVKKRPTSQTIQGPNDVEKPKEVQKKYRPEDAKEKAQMNKTQYQIFNIKMRLGKLGLNDTVRRFVQSIHDFDINVTKNSKDSNDIKSYLAPAQGNLIALKGALESLEAEFNELDRLLDEEK